MVTNAFTANVGTWQQWNHTLPKDVWKMTSGAELSVGARDTLVTDNNKYVPADLCSFQQCCVQFYLDLM